jgi:hypothetical protein
VIHLVSDYLDSQLLDRHGHPVGRIDGIVASFESGRQPRIIAVEVGSITLARRMSVKIGRWAERLSLRWGKMRPNPYCIPWSDLEADGLNYRVDVDPHSMPTLAWEHWLRKHVISRMPGA